MTRRFGIDTSLLVRLATGEPEAEFARIVRLLTRWVEVEHHSLVAAPMVIGEAYIALQHHYGVSKAEARRALRSVLTSGLVAPSGGQPVLDALAAVRGAGLMDRLIALQYEAEGVETLTLDRKMAALPNVSRLALRPTRE